MTETTPFQKLSNDRNLRFSRHKLNPLKFSWEEVNERRENGMCIFCDEQETAEHHRKHKNIVLVLIEGDTDSSDDDDQFSGSDLSSRDVGETDTSPPEGTNTKKKVTVENPEEIESKDVLKSIQLEEMDDSVSENESREINESIMESYGIQQLQVPISVPESSLRLCTNPRIVLEDLPNGSMKNGQFKSSFECDKGFDVSFVDETGLHVKMEVLSLESSSGNHRDIAHNLFDETSLGVTSLKKPMKPLKNWKFKFKTSLKNDDSGEMSALQHTVARHSLLLQPMQQRNKIAAIAELPTIPRNQTHSSNSSEKKQALISLCDKRALVYLDNNLQELRYTIVSNGGTASTLENVGVSVTKIEMFTHLLEMFDNCGNTWHPIIHSCSPNRRDVANHMEARNKQSIGTLDVVVVNLYQFYANVTAPSGVNFEDVTENIAFSGSTMIRAAANNYNDALVCFDSWLVSDKFLHLCGKDFFSFVEKTYVVDRELFSWARKFRELLELYFGSTKEVFGVIILLSASLKAAILKKEKLGKDWRFKYKHRGVTAIKSRHGKTSDAFFAFLARNSSSIAVFKTVFQVCNRRYKPNLGGKILLGGEDLIQESG